MTTIHIIVPIVSNRSWNHEEIARLARPDLRITVSALDRGPPSIESEYDEALAVPGIIANALEAERNGADAIVIDCMGDPGLRPVREIVSVPVVGPAETAMHLAATLGSKFSIVTVLESVRPMLSNLARLYGLESRLASVVAIDIPVLEIESRIEEVRQRLSEAALRTVEQQDADVIILGCTGFLGCSDAIATLLRGEGHDIPVIDPIPTAVCIAEAMVRAGLRHSKRTYARPRPKQIVGFDGA